jgi:hypothetical protein
MPRTTKQDARSVDARNSPGNRKLRSRALKPQHPRTKKTWNPNNGEEPNQQNPTAKPTPKKVRQTCAKPLKITNNFKQTFQCLVEMLQQSWTLTCNVKEDESDLHMLQLA